MREAYGILGFLAVALAISLLFWPPLAVVIGVMILFVLYFFRDPDRMPVPDPTSIVAAADGCVVAIETKIEGEYIRRQMIRVSIFLSVIDVHVNRSPIAGRVVHSDERKGVFLDARNPDSSLKNACRLWVIEGATCTVAVRQISGAIARRIVPWAQVGDELEKGERFGMIRFGSRTEIYVPETCRILVKVGESVRSGVTPIAELPEVDAPLAAEMPA